MQVCPSPQTDNHAGTPAPYHSVFYRPDVLPATQPTASKHWRLMGEKTQNLPLHPSAHLSADPTHHCKWHTDPISHFSTINPLERQTHRPTDGIGDKPYALYYNDAANNELMRNCCGLDAVPVIQPEVSKQQRNDECSTVLPVACPEGSKEPCTPRPVTRSLTATRLLLVVRSRMY